MGNILVLFNIITFQVINHIYNVVSLFSPKEKKWPVSMTLFAKNISFFFFSSFFQDLVSDFRDGEIKMTSFGRIIQNYFRLMIKNKC